MQKATKKLVMIIEKLFERYIAKKQHPDGTYVSAELDPKFQDAIFKWAKENGIPNLADPKQYHATIAYSRKGIPEVKSKDFKLPIAAEITGWKIFPTQTGGKCLVASLKSEQLTSHFNDIMDNYGATYDFPSYQPHITVSYDYGSDVAPKTFPKIKVQFNKVRIEPLDPEKPIKKAK